MAPTLTIPLAEDAAEALGGTCQGRPAGEFGDLVIFSFMIITTSGDGSLVFDRKEWSENARFLATQARDLAPHYQHSVVGCNYRLNNLLAGLGRGSFASSTSRSLRGGPTTPPTASGRGICRG